MLRPADHRRILILLAVGFTALHVGCLLLFAQHQAALSFFLIVPPVFAGVACVIRARSEAPRPQLLWLLLAGATAIWTIASVMSVREQFILRTPEDVAAGSQIAYFLYGIPLLLALALQTESSVNAPLFWLDGVQVAITGFLLYLEVFNTAPFLSYPTSPVPVRVVMLTFNIENVVLAVAATLRYLAAPPREELRHFYRTLAVFVWIYALALAIYNYVDVATGGSNGFYAIALDIPFLVVILAALRTPLGLEQTPRSARAVSLAMLLDNGSPAVFPAIILAFGIAIARVHFVAGTACIAVSVTIYGIRSTLLQVQYQRAQGAASAARDQMEILSLTDQLTGIPNRRQFDRVILAEWNRLSRQPGPLSMLLVDIDHFKYLNDAFGHGEGDISLRQVANVLQASLRRESDTLARYGGEEFAAVLPNTDAAGALAIAGRMAANLRNMKLRNKCPMGDTLTISIGRATCDLPSGLSMEMLFNAADQALYLAKQNGRDRTEMQPMPAV